MIYFLIWAVLHILSLGINMARHGEPEKTRVNFWRSLLSLAFTAWLMYMWGAFDTLIGGTS